MPSTSVLSPSDFSSVLFFHSDYPILFVFNPPVLSRHTKELRSVCDNVRCFLICYSGVRPGRFVFLCSHSPQPMVETYLTCSVACTSFTWIFESSPSRDFSFENLCPLLFSLLFCCTYHIRLKWICQRFFQKILSNFSLLFDIFHVLSNYSNNLIDYVFKKIHDNFSTARTNTGQITDE